MRIDFLPCSGHPLPSLDTAVDIADGLVGELVDKQARRLRAALVLWVSRQTAAARLDATQQASSKTHVEIHILQSQRGHNSERIVS